MRYIDAHIHLADQNYSQIIKELIEETKHSNVIGLIANSTNLESSQKSLYLAEKYPEFVYAALGIHPWNTKELEDNEVNDVTNLIINNLKHDQTLVAIGEIGLDAKYSGTGYPTEIQIEVFQKMLKLAEKTTLPAIIHSRGATEQIMNMLPSYKIKKILLHWFSQPHSLIPTIIDRGYFISEGPTVLYSKGIQEIIEQIPLTNLLTETDGPVRFRGPFDKRLTTPSFIPTVVETIAQLKKQEKNVVSEQIFRNFIDFFGLKA
ncbi:MAG: TatD family hydrolase [Candidatus Bathyarchaeota archaeon]